MKACQIAAFLLLLSLLGVEASQAQTKIEKMTSETKRFVPLKKVTVGPDDQYQSALDPSGEILVYTAKADLVAHLQAQVLKTGDVTDLLPISADSQEPTFSPGGKLAFTYYRFNARGDICYVAQVKAPLRTLSDGEIKCLKRSSKDNSGSERANPFWKSSNELGFLERDITTQLTRVVIENIDTGEQQILAAGLVWSPQMISGGRYLAYVELSEAERGLVLRDLKTSRAYRVRLSVPGLSGFPTISAGEEYLYFSHFLNDTNQDNVIDGGDNGVVLRLPIQKFLASASQEQLPEQLTSVESSCSFPRPLAIGLFVTCAFEGSLDIYQLPLSGAIPADWDQKTLENALKTSRSYEDRILVLNALGVRGKLSGKPYLEKLLTNHILADETVAARYYLQLLAKDAQGEDRLFFELLRIYLLGRELKKIQPSSEITREFERELRELDGRAAKLAVSPRGKSFQATVRGLLQEYLRNTKGAEGYLKAVRFQGSVRPLERVLYFELANRIYQNQKATAKLHGLYRELMLAPELSEEAHLYYAFELLKSIAETDATLPARLKMIESIRVGLPKPTETLLQAEISVLKIMAASDDAAKLTAYRDLDKLMSATREEYFLRKALYIRAITNFVSTNDFAFMDFVATNWIRNTKTDDTEFIFAREVFQDIALDRAYSNWAAGKLNLARDYSYTAMTFTDDLEAHSSYVRALTGLGRRADAEKQYKLLKEREVIGESAKFVDALLILIDAEAGAAADPKSVKHLNAAIASLESMTRDRDSSVRYLLLGYIYLEKLLREAKGLEFNNDLFQEANRTLLLAYDSARDNPRVRASALQNLGVLHLKGQNPGLAARYLELRKKLGYVSDDERLHLTALLAKAQFRARQPELAYAELSALRQESKIAPVIEREAFYAMAAGRYSRAAELYEPLLKGGKITGERNLAKVELSYGFTLFKLGRKDDARAALKRSLASSSQLKAEKAGADRDLDFDPKRLEFIANGLLSQVSDGRERADALERRVSLLERRHELADPWQTSLMQAKTQLADALKTEDRNRAAQLLQETLRLTEAYGDANQYLGHAVVRSIANILAFQLAQPTASLTNESARLKKVTERAIAAMNGQKVRPPLLTAQRVRLEILWSAYERKILGEKKPLPQLQDSESELMTAIPAQWKELSELAHALEAGVPISR